MLTENEIKKKYLRYHNYCPSILKYNIRLGNVKEKNAHCDSQDFFEPRQGRDFFLARENVILKFIFHFSFLSSF